VSDPHKSPNPAPEPGAPTTSGESADLKLNFLGLSFDPHRLIYATILLIATLTIYDESGGELDSLDTLTAIKVSAILVAPLFALAMAHAFSDALDLQIKLGRRLTGHDRRHLLWSNLEYLYVALPPILMTLILGPTNVPGSTIIDLILVTGLISLFMWGVFAARKAHLPAWGQIRFGINYTVMGLLIVVVELVLTH
jgi:hypothetical protein